MAEKALNADELYALISKYIAPPERFHVAKAVAATITARSNRAFFTGVIFGSVATSIVSGVIAGVLLWVSG